MKKQRIAWIFAVALLALFFVGCAGFKATPPEGFAAYSKSNARDVKRDGAFKALSPDGVLYSVREEKHKPKASLDFWREATAKRMADAGYKAIDTLSLIVDGTQAFGLLLEAPAGHLDQAYLVVAVPNGKRLVVVEAAGPTAKFHPRRDAILAAVAKVDLR